jgi:hypothetical protein
MLVVGTDISDAGMKPRPVAVRADDGQLGSQHLGILDGHQVGMLGLQVAEERLDPGLVGRRARPTKVLVNDRG